MALEATRPAEGCCWSPGCTKDLDFFFDCLSVLSLFILLNSLTQQVCFVVMLEHLVSEKR